MWGRSERLERVAWAPPWRVLDQKEQRWLGLRLDVAKGEQRVERGSKAAKRLEGGLHEQELAGLVVVVVVLAELVEPMGLVMPVAKRVGGGKVVLAWFQMSASEVVLDMHVCEVQKLVPVEDVLAWDVAT